MVDFILSQEDDKETDFADYFYFTQCGCPMVQYAKANGFTPHPDGPAVGTESFNDKDLHRLECKYWLFEPDHWYRNFSDASNKIESNRKFTYKQLKEYVLSDRFKERIASVGITGIDYSRGVTRGQSEDPQGNEGTNSETQLPQ